MFYEPIKTTWKNLVTQAPHILFPDNRALHCFLRDRINEGFLKNFAPKGSTQVPVICIFKHWNLAARVQLAELFTDPKEP